MQKDRSQVLAWVNFSLSSFKICTSPGYPVSQSGQEVLCSQPAVYQQHWRFSPPPDKPHHRYLSGHPQGFPVPLPCLLHSTSTPASPVHSLRPHRRLQRAMVWSGSRPVNPTPGSSTAWASTCQHLPAPGPLSRYGWWTGPDSRAGTAPGFPSDQHSAEVSQQPRRTQPEDHVGLGVRAGLNYGPTGLDRSVMRLIGRRGWKNQRSVESEEFDKTEADLFKSRKEKQEVRRREGIRNSDVAKLHSFHDASCCRRHKCSHTISLSAVFDCVWFVTASQMLKDKGKDSCVCNVKRPKRFRQGAGLVLITACCCCCEVLCIGTCSSMTLVPFHALNWVNKSLQGWSHHHRHEMVEGRCWIRLRGEKCDG